MTNLFEEMMICMMLPHQAQRQTTTTEQLVLGSFRLTPTTHMIPGFGNDPAGGWECQMPTTPLGVKALFTVNVFAKL